MESDSLEIVDAQIHVFGPDTPERPWARRVGNLHGLKEFSAAEALQAMDEAGVRAAILVPPSTEGDRNDLCLAAAKAHPSRFAVVGRLSTSDPDAVSTMAGLLKVPQLAGLRMTFNRGRCGLLTGSTLDWFWALAEVRQLPIYVHAPGLMPEVRTLATRFPQLKLAVDHLGIGGETPSADIPGIVAELAALSRFANIAVKASALPCISRERYPFRDVHTYVRQIFDAFGPSRVFWGSDLTRLGCPYSQCISLFTDEMPFFSEQDLRLVMGKGLSRWLAWNEHDDDRHDTGAGPESGHAANYRG